STAISGVSSAATAYSMLPSTSEPTTCPAVRTTNRSPNPWSKMISAARRETAQPNSTANGRCRGANATRRSAFWLGWRNAPVTNRWLPASNACNAAAGVAGRSSTAGTSPVVTTGPTTSPSRRLADYHDPRGGGGDPPPHGCDPPLGAVGGV